MKTYDEITDYFKKDQILYQKIIELDDQITPKLDIDVYQNLLSSIISQQLSTKVARIIYNRFLDLFPDRYPNAKVLLAKDHSELRSIGLSNNKANYVRNVAEFSITNDMSFDYLNELTDQEIIDYLTQIKGVGKWTVQMILMFPMDRLNVFPVDDLGIQKAMKSLYNLDLEKKALKSKLLEISEQWHPYKTLASKYLWKIID